MSAEASRVRINIFLPFRQDSSERLAHSVERGRAPSPVIDKFRHLLGFFFYDLRWGYPAEDGGTSTSTLFRK
jgi:hypothetical protein